MSALSVVNCWLAGSGGAGGGDALNNGYFYNTVFQIDANGQADGTSYATEEGFMGNAFTYQGNAAVASNVFTFDGTGDYLECSRNSNYVWVPGSSLSIELRDVKFSSAGGTQALISSYEADPAERCWVLRYSAITGSLALTGSTDGSTPVDYADFPWTPLTDGTGYNITCTWDGANIRLYIDSQFVAKSAFSGKFYLTNNPLRIGCNFDSGAATNFFNGTMRAVRLTKGRARTISETTITLPTLPWPTTGTTTDPNYPDVVLLVGYDNALARVRDFSPYDWAINLQGNTVGNTAVTLADGTGMIAFDGTGDYINFWEDDLFEIGSADVTIECFARHAVNTASHTYVSKYNASGNQRSWAFQQRGDLTPDSIRWLLDDDGTTGAELDLRNAWLPAVDTIYHVELSRSGTTHRTFVDGTQVGTDATSSVAAFNSTALLQIGAVAATEFMNGRLAEVRMTKVPRHTANFTAPTGALDHE